MSATVDAKAAPARKEAKDFKSVEEFDEYFDNGGDISHMVDPSTIRRPNLEVSKVNVDMPRWLIDKLDVVAKSLSIPRQAVIKTLLAQALKDGRGSLSM